MEWSDRSTLVKVIRHEFGHIVAAKTGGFTTGSVTLKKNSAGAAINIMPAVSTIEEVRSFLERRIVVLYAGVLAESLEKGKITGEPQKLLETTAADDYSKVRENLRLLTGTYFSTNPDRKEFQEKMDAIDDALRKSAMLLVETNAKLIADLAVLFMRHWDKANQNAVSVSEFVLEGKFIDEFDGVSELPAAMTKFYLCEKHG